MKGASPSQTGIDVQKCALKVKNLYTINDKCLLMYGFT